MVARHGYLRSSLTIPSVNNDLSEDYALIEIIYVSASTRYRAIIHRVTFGCGDQNETMDGVEDSLLMYVLLF